MDSNSTRWWWTIASFGCCGRCGANVDRAIIAYDSATRSVFCGDCAEDAGIATRCVESRRARAARHERLIGDYMLMRDTA